MLIFVKKFELEHFKEIRTPRSHLTLVTPLLVKRDTLFSDACDYAERGLLNLKACKISDNHKFVVELPCKSSNGEEFDLLNKDRNSENETRVFMETANEDRVTMNALDNGSILIYVNQEELMYLDKYLMKKATEIWLYLRQLEGEQTKQDYMKVEFSTENSLDEICHKIKTVINNCDHLDVDESCI